MASHNGWENSVSYRLGLPQLMVQNLEGGRVCVRIPCSACMNTYEIYNARRYPPEVFSKKLQERGWDTRPGRLRCSTCKSSNRRSSRRFEDTIPTIKREEQDMDIKLSMTDTTVSVVVPEKSDLFRQFMNDKNERQSYWSFEVIRDKNTNEPRFVMTRNPAPEKLKAAGLSRGSYLKASKAFILSIRRGKVPHSDDFTSFSPEELELLEENGPNLIFKMPDHMKPELKTYRKPDCHPEVVEEKRQLEEAQRKLEEAEPEPIIEIEPVEEAIFAAKQEEELLEQLEQLAPELPIDQEPVQPSHHLMNQVIETPASSITKDTIGIYHAIDILNRYKMLMGDRLVFTIKADGQLSAMAEYG